MLVKMCELHDGATGQSGEPERPGSRRQRTTSDIGLRQPGARQDEQPGDRIHVSGFPINERKFMPTNHVAH